MQNDKDHLNVDLGFLDEAKPRETETIVKSGYKTNWRTIAIIGGLMVVAIIWANAEDKPAAPRRSTASPTTSAPAYQAPVATSDDTVSNGQFRCSRSDSAQADRLSPVNEAEITMQQKALESRRNSLDRLKSQINLSTVTQNSKHADIDSYNAMVERYNIQLGSFEADVVTYQARVDQFNAQVQAHNNYLLTHCRSSR